MTILTDDNNLEISGTINSKSNAKVTNIQELVWSIARDMTFGTYQEIPKEIMEESGSAELENKIAIDTNDNHFKISISQNLIANNEEFICGYLTMQGLVTVLLGDAFIRVENNNNCLITINSIKLPIEYVNHCIKKYREAHSYNHLQIKKIFHIGDNEALLAFSYKPRLRVNEHHFKNTCIDVIKSGFHIVEMDTIDVVRSKSDLNMVINLSNDIATKTNDHIARFSPNFSLPSSICIEYIQEYLLRINFENPVIKIDGNLDGLTTIQKIRELIANQIIKKSPIITTYPNLRYANANKLPNDVIIELLALSGSDIIYRGNLPRLESSGVPLENTKELELQSLTKKYDTLNERGWPTYTIAGGIHPGELHIYYELFGPKLFYFLGGAVSLHKKGIKQGAKLIIEIMEDARKKRINTEQGKKQWSSDLSQALKDRIGKNYPKSNSKHYLSPSKFNELKRFYPWTGRQ